MTLDVTTVEILDALLNQTEIVVLCDEKHELVERMLWLDSGTLLKTSAF